MIPFFRHTLIRIVATSIALIWNSPASCADDSDSYVGSPYSFLSIPSSTRVFGLGGVNVSVVVPDDVGTIDQNPSLLGPEFGTQFQLNYMRWLGDSNFAGLRACFPTSQHGAVGTSLQYFAYGSIEETDLSGEAIGTFSPRDINFSVTYSHELSEFFRGGFTMRLIHSNYAGFTALALAADLGLNYYQPEKDLSIGLVVSSLGGQLKHFNERNVSLPADILVGLTKRLGQTPLKLNLTAFNLLHWNSGFQHSISGSEIELRKPDALSNIVNHLVIGLDIVPSDKLNFSLGYNHRVRDEMTVFSRTFLSGFSLGAGLTLDAFGFGVSFSRPHAGSSTFMVNFTTNFYDLTH